ncbi:RNA polymerase sigma-70 factor (sigma-E family) [Allocatelliglobosispora scoriae]|uniref:RNA polymerase sigma-70 factor (Sigma-E family) n=1 Tax=Allocatelliglobosispora scoriae TaxID=643052 RepID=A0A841BNK4_9ACTN|nr:SigE family RNA polymerase sigma factor [Allocatelliglobosispora scoriae]MBB5868779.1 RNA polymerase sigma-70 factor (sigma-E family) [Allocatelliglobosispora scoriae]
MTDAHESFREYVQGRLPGLSRIAYLLTGDAHLAEELVQQTLISVAARWERVVAGGDPEPYIRRTLYHQHISSWRRRRHDALPVAEVPERPGRDHIGDIATAVTMRQALAQLAPRQRAVLVLRFYEDLTEVQTAAVLSCSVSTVKSQTRDALARMRTIVPDLAEALS